MNPPKSIESDTFRPTDILTSVIHPMHLPSTRHVPDRNQLNRALALLMWARHLGFRIAKTSEGKEQRGNHDASACTAANNRDADMDSDR